MPCHPARARKLLKNQKAKKQWKGGFFYIKLLEREDGYTQRVACGIDPGSKKEAFTIRSEKKTFLNIQTDAITHVKDRVEERRIMRQTRRSRNCPYRECRLNRLHNRCFAAPSTKARYDWKLTIVNMLMKLYPIDVIVYEDIKARSCKGKKKWNSSFSPLQTGKKYFLNKLEQLTEVIVKQGYETAEKRKELGLTKSKKKLSNSFFAHCVDSWVLAGFGLQDAREILDNTMMIFVRKIPFWKRKLHRQKFNKSGKRHRFGGTVSFKMNRGSIVKYKKLGLRRIGGFNTGSKKVRLQEFSTFKRGPDKQGIIKDLIFLANCNWAWNYSI